MKFTVSGSTKKGAVANFAIEVEAKNEKHATSLALVKIGSAQGVRKSMIQIASVKKSAGQQIPAACLLSK